MTTTMNATATETTKTRKPSGPRYGFAPKRVRTDPADVTAMLELPPLVADLPEIDGVTDDLDERHRDVWEQADRLRIDVEKLAKRQARLGRHANPFSETITWMDDRCHALIAEAELRRAIADLAPSVLETITRAVGEIVGLDAEDERQARKAAEAAGIRLDPHGSLDRLATPERERRNDRLAALRSAHRQWATAQDDCTRGAAAAEKIVATYARRWMEVLGL